MSGPRRVEHVRLAELRPRERDRRARTTGRGRDIGERRIGPDPRRSATRRLAVPVAGCKPRRSRGGSDARGGFLACALFGNQAGQVPLDLTEEPRFARVLGLDLASGLQHGVALVLGTAARRVEVAPARLEVLLRRRDRAEQGAIPTLDCRGVAGPTHELGQVGDLDLGERALLRRRDVEIRGPPAQHHLGEIPLLLGQAEASLALGDAPVGLVDGQDRAVVPLSERGDAVAGCVDLGLQAAGLSLLVGDRRRRHRRYPARHQAEQGQRQRRRQGSRPAPGPP